MKRTISFLLGLSVTVSLSLVACKNSKETAQATASAPTEKVVEPLPDTTLIVSFERTPCFGTCPVDKIEIRANGEASYEGKVYVDYLGKYKATVDLAMIDSVFTIAEEIGFFEAPKSFEPDPLLSNDFPSFFTMLHKPGTKHKVIDKSSAPQEYRKLYKALNHIIVTTDWTVEPGQ